MVISAPAGKSRRATNNMSLDKSCLHSALGSASQFAKSMSGTMAANRTPLLSASASTSWSEISPKRLPAGPARVNKATFAHNQRFSLQTALRQLPKTEITACLSSSAWRRIARDAGNKHVPLSAAAASSSDNQSGTDGKATGKACKYSRRPNKSCEDFVLSSASRRASASKAQSATSGSKEDAEGPKTSCANSPDKTAATGTRMRVVPLATALLMKRPEPRAPRSVRNWMRPSTATPASTKARGMGKGTSR
mmetsp:Transcript_138431/g.359772  ORF Transcript_138431/g.359772 Transcript_138431/m.359772 type:complete len:251 (+) Transcript_138431:310-1062(+)